MRYAEIIAGRIRQLCQQRGITINGLATLSGVKQSTIDNIIQGTVKSPTVKTLHCIAGTFNMTLAEFLDFPELNEYSLDDDTDD